MDIFSIRTFLLAGFSLIVYCVFLIVYRLYFSPIAKFPGSKLAASSLWYEFYYDVVKKGQYTRKIGQMHEKYGEPHFLPCKNCGYLPTLAVRPNHPYQSL